LTKGKVLEPAKQGKVASQRPVRTAEKKKRVAKRSKNRRTPALQPGGKGGRRRSGSKCGLMQNQKVRKIRWPPRHKVGKSKG